jgi:hypothetical protein
MTRSYNTRRRTQPMTAVRVAPASRDPSIETLSFTCFRLVAIDTPIRVTSTRNTMGIFAQRANAEAAQTPRRF